MNSTALLLNRSSEKQKALPHRAHDARSWPNGPLALKVCLAGGSDGRPYIAIRNGTQETVGTEGLLKTCLGSKHHNRAHG
eukprot:1895151-Amphidinium_carterae.1